MTYVYDPAVGGSCSCTTDPTDQTKFSILDYGAVSDGQYLRDGVTNSTTTFTSASGLFVPTDVGKYILIRDGIANQLITTIAAFVSPTQVTLTDAAAFTASNCEFYWGTDDTAAVQAAIDAAEANGEGTITGDGITVIAGPLQDTLRSNSQLVLPRVDAATASPVAITFEGPQQPYNVGSVTRTVIPSTSGWILLGMLNAGTDGQLIGGERSDGGFCNIHVFMDKLTVRMPGNPVLSAVDLSKVAAASVGSIVIDTGVYSDTGPMEPTTATSFGLKMPENNNGVENIVGNAFILGFYNNFREGEHTSIRLLQTWYSKNSITLVGANHASRAHHIISVHNQNHLVHDNSSDSFFDADLFDIEHAPASAPAWRQTAFAVVDPNNFIRGSCKYHTVLGFTGPVDNFPKNGGGYFVSKNSDGGIIGAKAYSSVTQSIPPSVATALTLNSEEFDSEGIHDTSTNTSRLTCKTAGVYLIEGNMRYSNNTTGTFRLGQIDKNGSSTLAQGGVPVDPTSGSGRVNISAIDTLVPGEYVEFVVFHDASVALDTAVVAGNSPSLSMVRIGD